MLMDNLWTYEKSALTRCSDPPEALAHSQTMGDPRLATLGYRRQAVKGNVQLGPYIEIFQLSSVANAEKHKLPWFVVVVNGSFSVMATIFVTDFADLLELLNQRLVFLS